MGKGPFKMKGFSGYANSPLKQDKPKAKITSTKVKKEIDLSNKTYDELIKMINRQEGDGSTASTDTVVALRNELSRRSNKDWE